MQDTVAQDRHDSATDSLRFLCVASLNILCFLAKIIEAYKESRRDAMFVAVDRKARFSSVGAECSDLLNKPLCESFGARGRAGTYHSSGVRVANAFGYYKDSTPTEFGSWRRGLNEHYFWLRRAVLRFSASAVREDEETQPSRRRV